MGDRYPVRAVGTGGRQQRTGPEYGHIYDHFSTIYEYEGGAKLFATCRQQVGCDNDISAHVLGTKGRAALNSSRRGGGPVIEAGVTWHYTGPPSNVYQAEHDAFFASIRRGQPINNGQYMAKSTLLAIMGRMAACTGQVITWDQALGSTEDLSPPRYDWDVPLSVPPVAIPGQTEFA
jgi:hypothetical protein